jgi:hypothetical protein
MGSKIKNDKDNHDIDHLRSEMKKVQCSPFSKSSNLNKTCLSNENLFKLRDLWNSIHKDAKILSNDPDEIWETLDKNMQSVCNDEICWVSQPFVDKTSKKEINDSFAPLAPKEWKKNKNEWLSSDDISRVMDQYEKAYPNFKFIGPSPIDYDENIGFGVCVWDELCKFKLKKHIHNGKDKLGIIFNLDNHSGPGTHWVSLFINIKSKTIFYFDSAGQKIPRRIKHFAETVTEQGENLSTPITFKFDQNHPIEHQKGNTECGMYSLYFIVHMLEDHITGEYLKTHRIPDKMVENFRKIYFNQL